MKLTAIIFLFLSLLLFSCKDEKPEVFNPPKTEALPVNKADTVSQQIKKHEDMKDSSGIAGIFEVEEMLAITVRDSGDASSLSKNYARAFALLESEMKEMGIQTGGAPGIITYNDDPSNTIFDCLYPVNGLPKVKPKHARVGLIPGELMLIYNHYGSYTTLNDSYQRIVNVMMNSGLLKTGPLREFYITDPSKERDTTKWLTRIMVPVIKKETLKKKSGKT